MWSSTFKITSLSRYDKLSIGNASALIIYYLHIFDVENKKCILGNCSNLLPNDDFCFCDLDIYQCITKKERKKGKEERKKSFQVAFPGVYKKASCFTWHT